MMTSDTVRCSAFSDSVLRAFSHQFGHPSKILAMKSDTRTLLPPVHLPRGGAGPRTGSDGGRCVLC